MRLLIAGKISDRILLPHIKFFSEMALLLIRAFSATGCYFVLLLGSKTSTTTSKWLHYTRNYIWLWFAKILSIDSWPIPYLEHRERAVMVIVKNLPRGNSASLKQKVCALKRQCCSMNSGIKLLSAMEKWQAIYTSQTCCKI